MSASAPRDGLARLISAMILTWSAGASAARASRAAGRARAAVSTSEKGRWTRRSSASAMAPASSSESTRLVTVRCRGQLTHAVAGLGHDPADDSADDQEAEGGPYEPRDH